MPEGEIDIGLDYWIKYIRKRIKNNKNFLVAVIGQTGSGKSYATISMSDILHNYNLPFDNICFKASQFMKRLDEGLENNTLPKGSVLDWDEVGVDLNAKDWQTRTSKIISKVMQTFRTENLIVFFTVPFLDFISKDSRKLLHAYFQTEKIDRKRNVVIVKPFLIQVNQVTGKMYRKRLRVKSPDGGIVKVRSIAIPMPRKELVDFYEEKSGIFKRNIIKESRAEFERIEEKKNEIKSGIDSVKRLTAKQAHVFGRRYMMGWTFDKIAEEMGISQEAVIGIDSSLRKKLILPIGNASFQDTNLSLATQST